MGFDVRAWPAVLGLLTALLASWLGVAILIASSIASNQAARLMLLVWALVVAGWFAVYAPMGTLVVKRPW